MRIGGANGHGRGGAIAALLLLLCHGATAAGSTTLAGAYTLDWTADSTFVYFTLTLQSNAWYVGASRAVRGWREVTRHWRGVAFLARCTSLPEVHDGPALAQREKYADAARAHTGSSMRGHLWTAPSVVARVSRASSQLSGPPRTLRTAWRVVTLATHLTMRGSNAAHLCPCSPEKIHLHPHAPNEHKPDTSR
jgi:hypothetical protein